jgi:hypothetical protein
MGLTPVFICAVFLTFWVIGEEVYKKCKILKKKQSNENLPPIESSPSVILDLNSSVQS